MDESRPTACPLNRRPIIDGAGSRSLVAARLVGRRDRGAARLPADLRSRRSRRRAPSASSCARSAPPSAATSSIVAAACSRPAWTPTRSTRSRPKSATPSDAATKLCGALDDCDAKERQALTERLGQQGFAYVRRQVSPDQARARRGAEPRRHRLHQREQALLSEQGTCARTCSATSASTTPAWTVSSHLRLADSRQARHDPRAHRCQAPCVQPIRAAADHRFDHRADDRRVPAAHRRARAARRRRSRIAPPAAAPIIMNPRTGEILAMANEPTFNPNAYRESDETERRNRAVQDLYEPGSTFKIVTASAAIEEKVMPIDTMIDTNPGQLCIDRATLVHRRCQGATTACCRSPTSSSSRATSARSRSVSSVGTERLSRFVALYGFGRRSSPDFPGESPGIVWSPEKWTESALASVSMGYQVGVTPLQMVAAVSSVANGGQYVEPRVVRAVYRDNARYAVAAEGCAAHHQRRHRGDADRRSWKASSTDGTAKRAQIDGYTIAGKTGTAAEARQRPLFDIRTTSRRSSGSCRRAIRRSRSSSSSTRRTGRTRPPAARCPRRSSSASPSRRCAISASRRRSIRRRRCSSRARTTSANAAPATSARRRAGCQSGRRRPPGTVPDLHGLSAREAVRSWSKLGMTRALSGDGFVVSQDPRRVAARARTPSAASCSNAHRLACWCARASHDLGRAPRRAAGTRPHPRRRCAAGGRRRRRRHRHRVRLAHA